MRRIAYTIEHLAEQGYLTLSDDELPVLRTNARSAAGLRGETPITLKLPQEKEPIVTKRKKAMVQTPDLALFEKLSALRLTLANEADVPAFVGFSDASLRGICLKMPSTHEEFLNASGVGQAKLKKYGDAFLQVIRSHISQV